MDSYVCNTVTKFAQWSLWDSVIDYRGVVTSLHILLCCVTLYNGWSVDALFILFYVHNSWNIA